MTNLKEISKNEIVKVMSNHSQRLYDCYESINKLMEYKEKLKNVVGAIFDNIDPNTDDKLELCMRSIILGIGSNIATDSIYNPFDLIFPIEDNNMTSKEFESTMMDAYAALDLAKYKVKYDFLGSNITEGISETKVIILKFDKESIEILQNEYNKFLEEIKILNKAEQ